MSELRVTGLRTVEMHSTGEEKTEPPTMTAFATYALCGEVAIVKMTNAPINGLGFGLRTALLDALDRALLDSAVRAIVLTGSARAFSAGADLREFGTSKVSQAPTLRSLIDAFELSSKPVIAAIAGACLGGGFELALGCHFRVALSDASLGLPEVKLGLLPGAGGTQRLPRLIGLEAALNVIVSGAPVTAERFAGTSLIDLVVQGDVIEAAVAFARRVLADQRPPRRTREMKLEQRMAEPFLQFARTNLAAASKNLPASLRCVEAVAAGINKSFDEGMTIERDLFLQLMQTPESRAFRHAFSAERAASKVPGLAADTQRRRIDSVGVIGGGTMGSGISMCLVNAGIPVILLETSDAALNRGLMTIRLSYESSLKKGRITKQQLDERMALITPTLAYDSLGNVDMVIEAVFESLDVKREVFSQVEKATKKRSILATNTSALDLNQIAAFTNRPQDTVGLHFFSPANVMRLLEVVRGDKTAPDVLATSLDFAKRIGKIAVVAGVCDGFIGNRMVARYGAAANDLLTQGALPQQVDSALQSFGFAMGPFRMGDLAGLDIGWAGRKRRAAAQPGRDWSVVADRLCEAGRLGQKTGAGWYRYKDGGREPIPDAVVEGMIDQFRRDKGFIARPVHDTEVIERCLYALVNEGARILEEGIAARASDIDVVYLNGYGFPRHRGGPMHYAQEIGLANVVRVLRRIAAEPGMDRAVWTPAPLLVRLAEEGRSFD